MISKEKRREYVQRYRKKYPEKYRKQNQLDTQRRKNAQLIAKTEGQDAVIADLQEKLKKAEHDAKWYAMENQRLRCLHDKARKYLKFYFDENDHRADAILLSLDFIYKSED